MSMPTTKVLMSAGNPTGRKLEELLADIIQDVHLKNDALEGDASPTSAAIRVNNLGIIDCLALAGVRQSDTLRRLNLLGPDQGPGGPPRIATDSAANPAPLSPQPPTDPEIDTVLAGLTRPTPALTPDPAFGGTATS